MGADINIVAKTMYGEARGEDTDGWQAVANVIMNRVAKKTWYGLTPYEVCLKPKQFSCWNFGDPNCEVLENIPVDSLIYRACIDLATRAVNGVLPDITLDATHYRVIGTGASWDPGNKLVPCKIIGRHEFFNTVS